MTKSCRADSIVGPTFVGIDISLRSLEVAAPGLKLTVPNTKDGHKKLISAVKALGKPAHYVCESDRVYGRSLYESLYAKRCCLSLVSAYRVRQFAKATGRLAKTDAIDAEIISRYGAAIKPAPTPRPSQTQMHLVDLVRRRQQLAQLREAQVRQSQQLANKELKADCEALTERIRDEMRKLDEAIAAAVATCPMISRKHAALCDVPGVAANSAAQLLAELPELGTLNRGQVAALAGLAPVNRESGSLAASRHIQGGRAAVRRIIFMPTRVGIWCNPVLKQYYRKLRRRGKPFYVCVVAAMRKLLIHLNAVARRAEYEPMTPPPVGSTGRRKWTAEDDELLLCLRKRMTVKMISRKMGRSESALSGRIGRLRQMRPD